MTGFDQSDRDRLEVLEVQIGAAQKDNDAKPVQSVPISDRQALSAGQVGFALMGTVLAGIGLGWLVDSQIGTSPWGVLVGLFAGFAAGIANAWRIMKVENRAVGAPNAPKPKKN